jgi:hypothetical protein
MDKVYEKIFLFVIGELPLIEEAIYIEDDGTGNHGCFAELLK